jgi:hypothetical protein
MNKRQTIRKISGASFKLPLEPWLTKIQIASKAEIKVTI